MLLMDGIRATKNELVFGFRIGSIKSLWIPFSETDPPEVLREYVFSCELDECDPDQIVIARSESQPPRHHNPAHTPYLVRVHSECDQSSKIRGFVSKIKGYPRFLFIGKGVTTIGGKKLNSWTDALVVLEKGDAVTVRPAGTSEPIEYVIEYTSIGIGHKTLEHYLA